MHRGDDSAVSWEAERAAAGPDRPAHRGSGGALQGAARADARASSAEMRERVCTARELQRRRGFSNAHIPPNALRKLTALDDAGAALEMAARRLGLSARAHDRILKVARTIADLDRVEMVSSKHLAEAVQYRSLDRNYWQ